jgi:hypothetical protein
MPAPLFPAPSITVAAASPGPAAFFLAWIITSGLVALVAVIRVMRRPAADWLHGLWSKIGWVLLVLYLAVPVAGYPIPVGAVAAIWRTRPPQPPRPAELPYADGTGWEGK